MDYINMDKRFKMAKMLIWNLIFLLLFATPAVPQANAFGFDSANSCNTNGNANGKLSRRGRAQMLAAIPCDLTRQAYCHLPGAAYPWHAVRRFVHENHGLMKRMYGDVRHISVLRDEMLSNEIEVGDVEMAAERYSKDGQRRTAKFMHNREEFVALKGNDVLMEPHFRPVSSTAATTTTTATSTTTTTTASSTSSTVTSTAAAKPHSAVGGSGSRRRVDSSSPNAKSHYGNANGTNRRRITGINRWEPNRPTPPTRPQRRKTTAAGIVDEEREKGAETVATSADDDNLESNSVYEVPTSPETDLSIGDNIQIIESPQLGYGNDSESATISTTLKVVATAVVAADGRPAPAPTSLQKQPQPQPQPIRQRPTATQQHQQQQQQQQQSQKANSTISKESFNSKTNETSNESERIPTTTTTTTTPSPPPTASAAVKGNNNKRTGATGMDNNSDNNDDSETSETNNKKNGDNSNINRNNVSTEPTITTLATANSSRTSQQPTPAAAASTSLSSGALPEAAVSASLAATTMETNVELLSDEKLQKPPAATSATATAAATAGAAAATAPTKPVLRDGQLYQDTLKPEVKPSANARGINACPVKEEVVAPFWANNTRGEVLALLNLYPFEQYVHWEKCTHEHRQMYCRDGCRCEQQYRLHRLLAYDPHNECRGIFSDWFRFPSCCICKCYGMPMEFRATSRSPRSERGDADEYSEPEHANSNGQRHPIDVAEETVRKAIYEHATEDWYRPKDEFDFYEG